MSEEDEERVRQIVREVMAETLPRLFASGGLARNDRKYIVGETPHSCFIAPRKS